MASQLTTPWSLVNSGDRLSCRPEAIAGRQVDVWRARLELTDGQLRELATVLADDERDRANQFHDPDARRRFVAARGQLRTVLGGYLGRPPQELEFGYGPQGKPYLRDKGSAAGPELNLSHSGELAVIAVCGEGPVGVDIERVRNGVNVRQIASRYFKQGEWESLHALGTNGENAGFFQAWTRHEACLKATGIGISDAAPGNLAGFAILDLRLPPGYIGALAILQNGCRLERMGSCAPAGIPYLTGPRLQ